MNIFDEISKMKKISYVDNNNIMDEVGSDDLNFKVFGEQINMGLKNQQLIEKEVKTNFKNAQNIEKLYGDMANIRDTMNSLSINVESSAVTREENEKMAKLFMYFYDYIDDKKNSMQNVTELKHETSRYILEQIESILKKAREIMKKADISVEDPEFNKFDTDLHEIVGTEENEELENEAIIRVVKKGFIYKGKILRKSKVITILNRE